MKIFLSSLLAFTCVHVFSVNANGSVIDDIGKPISKEEIMEKWPSNSVYQSFGQVTRFADGTQTIYRRYLVDEPGLNPGHGRENTHPITHVDPVVEYHVIENADTQVAVLEGVEVFQTQGNQALFQSFCVDMGIKPLSFHEAVSRYPDQIWDGAEHNIVDISSSSPNKKSLFVYGHYIDKALYSVLVTRTYLSRNLSPQGDQAEPLTDENDPQPNIIDISYLRTRAMRLHLPLSPDAQKNAESSIRPRRLESLKKDAKKGTPIFERMAKEGIRFQRHTEDFRLILPSELTYYTSGMVTVTTIGRFDSHPLRAESIADWFIDLRRIPTKTTIVFPQNRDIPRTLEKCREQFTVLAERSRHDKVYTYIDCGSTLIFLFQQDNLVAVASTRGAVGIVEDGKLYTENLWYMLDFFGLTLRNANGFIFGSSADIPNHTFFIPGI